MKKSSVSSHGRVRLVSVECLTDQVINSELMSASLIGRSGAKAEQHH
jgi:hypothetical protein